MTDDTRNLFVTYTIFLSLKAFTCIAKQIWLKIRVQLPFGIFVFAAVEMIRRCVRFIRLGIDKMWLGRLCGRYDAG